MNNAWILCPPCQRWHFKAAPCMNTVEKYASNMAAVSWLHREIAFLNEEETEIYGVMLAIPYLHTNAVVPPQFSALDETFQVFLQLNAEPLKYVR